MLVQISDLTYVHFLSPAPQVPACFGFTIASFLILDNKKFPETDAIHSFSEMQRGEGDPRTPMAWQHRDLNYHQSGYQDKYGPGEKPSFGHNK